MRGDRIQILRHGSWVELRLCRPELHNAFDPAMIAELTRSLQELSEDLSLRLLVLAGEGKNFCAGADLNWMRESAGYTSKRNEEEALRLHRMFQALHEFPRPTLARVQGAVFGGGVGLVACCDAAVAAADAVFCLSEVRLGILPAVIGPFLIRKIGVGNYRAYGLSAKPIPAAEALRIGLAQEVVPLERLDAAVQEWVDRFLGNGPEAMARLKSLIAEIEFLPTAEAAGKTARAIARARAGKEGQEGLKAFLDKGRPAWRPAKKPK